MTACGTCELLARRDAGDAPAWDAILRTENWDLVHAFDSALDGWLVLVARRHIAAVADMTDVEAAELGPLVRAASRALGTVVGCERTYVVLFAESPSHRHVHVHVIPRRADMPDDQQGPRVFSQLGVPPEQRVPDARMHELAVDLRAALGG
jgi:diadenosine tetraphosphate (Ap4A) HIT family hydrolase